MKWGRKKSSPPSSRSSLITRVFPVSWFSNFKQKGGGHEITSGKKQQQRGKLDFPTRKSSFSAGWREAIFYSIDDADDAAYWRLSFCEERAEARKRTGKINPLWYDSDDDFQVSASSFKSFGFREMELPRRVVHRSINDMVSDIEKMKEMQCREAIQRDNGAFRKKKPNQRVQLRKDDVNCRRSRKLSRRIVRRKKAEMETDDGERKSSKPMETDVIPKEAENMDRMKEEFWDSDEEDCMFAAMDGEGSNANSERVSISKCQNLGNKKFKETKVKTESQGKSAYKSRGSHSRKIKQNRKKGYTSKSECRIQVLEDMKKAKAMMKKKERREQSMEGCSIFSNFAVEKSSFNPQQDFRDSMVEMIRYKGIRRPEELEELLACYLTLNCDRYHDLIVKVFQQVWFELSRGVY